METLTMQGIADLTRVQREVVSMWRTRAATTAAPFPEPLPGAQLRFEAQGVAAWLQETGRGNNPEAHLEVALYSTRFDQLLEDVDATSTLLVLYHALGGPLAEIDAAEAIEYAHEQGLPEVLDPEALPELLSRTAIARDIDDLVEAAFSGQRLLDRLVDTFVRPAAPWAEHALTRTGATLLGEILRVLLDQSPRTIEPLGAGGLVLAGTVVDAAGDVSAPAFRMPATSTATARMRAAWRRFHAHGARIAACDDGTGGARPGEGRLFLIQRQDVRDPAVFFDDLEATLMEVGPDDAALVVGPAELLIDPLRNDALQEERSRVLFATGGYVAPLRYVARLPKGLSRYGGRRRLALWVLGSAQSHAGTEWTVVGEHADTTLDASARSAIAADVAAALTGGPALTTHAFLSSTRLATQALVRRPRLTAPPVTATTRTGGESLARIWDLDDGLLGTDLPLVSAAPDVLEAQIPWDAAVPRLAREVRGSRLPAAEITQPAAGTVTVIGPQEVRHPATVGRRAIDRLTLERVAARSILTQPGDVLFTAEGGAAAFVDAHGGHVLQAPVRALRVAGGRIAGRALHPHVLAADLAHQHGRDRRTWRVRTVPVEALPALDHAAARIAERRDHLTAQLATIDALEAELTDALAAGTLTPADPRTPH